MSATAFFRIKKTIFGTLAIAVLATAMIGFGVDPFGGSSRGRKDYAIKVGDKNIKHEEFYKEKRNIQQRYRQYFGENYEKFISMLGQGINQQAIDSLTSRAIVEKLTDGIGLVGSDNATTKRIFKDLFSDGKYDEARYKNFLLSQGMTSRQFEESVKASIGREQLVNFVADVVEPSDAEILNRLKRAKTNYKVASISLDPATLTAEIKEPEQKQIEEYYNKHKSEYEEPMKLSYDYIVIDEKAFPDLVQIPQSDIDVYYADNQSKFKTEEERKVSLITLKVPENSDESKKAGFKKRAEEILSKIKAGEKFANIAKGVTEDKLSQEKGGEFGWVSKNDTKGLNAIVFNKVFTQKVGSAESQVIEDKDAIYIVQIDEEKPSAVKPLQEVKAEIETILKKEQYPSFLSAKADELLEEFRKKSSAEKITLATFAEQNKLPLKTASLLSDGKDPEPTLKGLTSALLDTPDVSSQVVQLDELNVLANIKEVKQPEISTLDVMKDKIVKILKSEATEKLAEEKANTLIKEINDKKYADVKTAAVAWNATSNGAFHTTVKEYEEFSAEKPAKELTDPKLVKDITSKTQIVSVLPKSYLLAGKRSLIQIVSVTEPKAEELIKEFAEFKNNLKSQTGEIASKSLISYAKAQIETDVDSAIMR